MSNDSALPDIQSLFNALPGVIYRLDMREGEYGKLVFVNNKIKDITGYCPDDFLNGRIRWIDLIYPDDVDYVQRSFRNIGSADSYTLKYRCINKDGECIWIMNQGQVTFADEKATFMDGVIIDITTAKRHQQQLLLQQQQMDDLVSSLDDIVLLVDSRGNFKNYFTKDWRKLMLPPGAFLNKPIREAFQTLPEYARVFETTYFQTITTKESHEVEFAIDELESKRWFRARFSNLKERGSVSILISDITERKTASFALKQNEEALQWASRTAKIGGWELDLQSMTLYWSDEIHRIHELEKSHEGLSAADMVRDYEPSVKPILSKSINEAIHNGVAWDLELPLVTSNGTKKWVRDVGMPEMRDGKCIALKGMVQDITERKSYEIALAEKELSLELALKGANLGTWDWSFHDSRSTYNARWMEIVGYTEEEFCAEGLSWEKLLYREDARAVFIARERALSGTAEFFEVEYRLRHKAGHLIWVYDKGKVVERASDGTPRRMSGTLLDITRRKSIEVQNSILRDELEGFKLAVNKMSIVSITDLEGTILYANENFQRISQYKFSELVGKNHNIVNSGYHPKSFWVNMWKTVSKGVIWRKEVKNKRKDGTYYWVDTFIVPLRGGSNSTTQYLSIRNDITEKKENEVKLQSALKKAEESDRLKSIFLANVSHEIRTPMNAIMGLAELLERPNFTDTKRNEFSRLIRERGTDLLNLVNDILDISRIEARQVSTVKVQGSIGELFEKLLLTFHAQSFHLQGKNVSIRSINELGDDENFIVADFIRLNQVLTNLLSNACKFTNDGEIVFGCQLKNPETLLLWVSDTGIGIPESEQENVFKPFRQASEHIHQMYGGTGLGLAICRGLVEIWGGRMWVDSTEHAGSTFYFTMPFTPADYPAKEKYVPVNNWLNRTLLLVEDDPISVRYFSELIAATRISVLHSSSAQDALSTLARKTVDVAVLDINLPDINGFDLCAIIKKSFNNLPTIALTSHADDQTRKRCTEAAFNTYLTKPVTKAKLIREIANVLDSK